MAQYNIRRYADRRHHKNVCQKTAPAEFLAFEHPFTVQVVDGTVDDGSVECGVNGFLAMRTKFKMLVDVPGVVVVPAHVSIGRADGLIDIFLAFGLQQNQRVLFVRIGRVALCEIALDQVRLRLSHAIVLSV